MNSMEIRRAKVALCPLCAVSTTDYVIIGYDVLPKVGPQEEPPPRYVKVTGCQACFLQQSEVEVMFSARRITLPLRFPEGFNPCRCVNCGTLSNMQGVLMAWRYSGGKCTMQQTLTSVCSECASLGILQGL